MSDEQQLYTLALYGDTPKAILVGKEHGRKHEAFWLPMSQINIRRKELIKMKEYVLVAIPEWLAERNNLDVSLEGDLLEDLE